MENYQKTLSNGESFAIPVDGVGANIETLTASTTLTAEDSGKTFLIGTDALTITLPATVKGLQFNFINIGANGNNIITIAPAAADGIAGTIILAASIVKRVGTVNTALVNTKNTAILGDTASIIGTGTTGVSGWFINKTTGIWA